LRTSYIDSIMREHSCATLQQRREQCIKRSLWRLVGGRLVGQRERARCGCARLLDQRGRHLSLLVRHFVTVCLHLHRANRWRRQLVARLVNIGVVLECECGLLPVWWSTCNEEVLRLLLCGISNSYVYPVVHSLCIVCIVSNLRTLWPGIDLGRLHGRRRRPE